VLSAEQVNIYRKNGFLVVRELLNEAQLQPLRERTYEIAEGLVEFPTENIEFEPDGLGRSHRIDKLRKLNHCAQHDRIFLEHANNPDILDVVEGLIGPDIKLLSDQLFMKPPGGMEKTYHQDSPYFPIEPMDLVSSWVALDDVTLDNGCLWVVPGSHLNGPKEHSEKWMVGDREDMHVPDKEIDREKECPILLKSGDASFHHSLLLHRSGPNESRFRRRGLATHFMSARSRWTGNLSEKPDYVLLRGKAHLGCV
tara:strand:+ start:472 stop:1233 length:762 start_codon:yes stop_codon:yes gene_type:complete